DTLKNELAALAIQIDQANAQIQLTGAKIDELSAQLVKAQEELDRQKGLLKESMRALYKKGGASSLELLVASDSFSDYMNDQQYLETLKSSIQDSALKVIQLKAQIQAQQEQQKQLLVQQQAQRDQLTVAQNQQSNL